MADDVRTEEAEKPEGKKTPLASKIPLDAVLLVAVPFIVFVILFLHVMGFLPPQPLRIKVITPAAEAQQNQTQEPQATAEQKAPEDNSQKVLPQDQAQPGGENTASMGAQSGQPEEAKGLASEASGTQETQPKPEASIERKKPEEGTTQELAKKEQKASEDTDHEQKLKQLAKVYEQMKASSVAAILTNMSDEEAIEVLANMKPRNAAKVLASLEPERAAKLSRLLTE